MAVTEETLAQLKVWGYRKEPPLTNTVGSMQVVKAVWVDRLTVCLLLRWWKTPAHQRAGLCGQGRQ